MTYVLLPLPYALDALAPQMSAETLEFHHGKHHQGYVDKVNELAGQTSMVGRALVELIGTAGPGALFNNACQLWNHNFFWQCLAPTSTQPGGQLAELIVTGFGSVEAMLEQFSAQAVAHFGSGWAWLVLEQGAIKVTTYHDGDTPAAHPGVVPLFTLDLWEHAYYIDYRNARPHYVDAVLGGYVNWDFAALNLDGNGVSRADQAWMD